MKKTKLLVVPTCGDVKAASLCASLPTDGQILAAEGTQELLATNLQKTTVLERETMNGLAFGPNSRKTVIPIRPARMGDIKAIHSLLQTFAGKGLLLGRSISSLYDQLRDFIVYDDGGVQGVCSLHICWDNLAEIRSLAVAEDRQGRGAGRALVASCLDEAKSLEIDRVFTLTYQGAFFRKLQFVPIEKSELPHKIWSDCLQCPKFPDCDEEALIWTNSTGARTAQPSNRQPSQGSACGETE